MEAPPPYLPPQPGQVQSSLGGQQLVLRPTQEYGSIGPNWDVRSNAAAIVVMDNLCRLAE